MINCINFRANVGNVSWSSRIESLGEELKMGYEEKKGSFRDYKEAASVKPLLSLRFDCLLHMMKKAKYGRNPRDE